MFLQKPRVDKSESRESCHITPDLQSLVILPGIGPLMRTLTVPVLINQKHQPVLFY